MVIKGTAWHGNINIDEREIIVMKCLVRIKTRTIRGWKSPTEERRECEVKRNASEMLISLLDGNGS